MSLSDLRRVVEVVTNTEASSSNDWPHECEIIHFANLEGTAVLFLAVSFAV